MRLVIILFIFGSITAIIARSKGRDLFLWWFYGILLFPFALIHAIILQNNTEIRDPIQRRQGLIKCPHCAEMIKLDAKQCQFCGRKINIIDV
ncbi:MAG: zinc ribbon domain-containing protein [Nitrospira sp.]|nr:zinc ribbon domain-containing protein [Candidatus Manganitrophaceae bacterium]